MRIVINASGTQYYFELQADGNFETLATSERYVTKSDAKAAIATIQSEASAAPVIDNT